MGEQSVSVIMFEVSAAVWWALYIYSRRQTAEAKRAEIAKYAVWDEAYRQAVKAGKTEYYALMDAVKAVGGGPHIYKVWEDAYNKAINAGVRKYSATLKATKAARKAAHN